MTPPHPYMPVPQKRPRRWFLPTAVILGAVIVGAGVGWALTSRSTPTPAAATTPSPTPARMSEAAACLRAMDDTGTAIEIVTVFSKESSIDIGGLDRTVAGLQAASASLPAETQSSVADVLDPLQRMQRAYHSKTTGQLLLNFDLTDFKTGALAVTIDCGMYLPDEPDPAPDPNVIDEGVWTVGDDIRPGRYRTDERVDSDCYWSITRSGSNGDDIIANDIPGGGRPTVTLRKGQDFTTRGCGTWTRLK